MKVLIIQQKMIGDVLTSTILFEVLKERFPKSELHFLVNTSTVPVILHNPLIDRVIEFTR
ncbi:MAG: heptosyltransferase-2, partial [Patiriisocius sp.]